MKDLRKMQDRYVVARKDRSRNWEVRDDGELVCLCVYKKGALEVMRRLSVKEE